MCDMCDRDLVRVDGVPLSLVLPSAACKWLEFGSKPNFCCCFDGHTHTHTHTHTNTHPHTHMRAHTCALKHTHTHTHTHTQRMLI